MSPQKKTESWPMALSGLALSPTISVKVPESKQK